MSKHILLPHVPKRRGTPRWEGRFERFLDHPRTRRALGHPTAQRVLLGPEVIPALWGSVILVGAIGLAGFIDQIQWGVL